MMSENSYGVNLYDAEDVLPLGLVGTPWEIIFKSLRDVLKSDVDASDSGFMRKACALYFLAHGDLEAVTDRDVLNGIASALAIPYWVENFDDPAQASAIIYHWLKYKPTRAKLTALALASGMRAFKLREIYTSTEYGISHSFGFDLGDGYDTSFFAGPDAEPGNATAQRICGALTHFFLRIKDSPTLITDITYPGAPPSGWQYFFRADQSEIRILQGYRWDLFDSDGNLAFTPDEYAVITPIVVRDKFGVNTTVTSLSEVLILDDGQLKLAWGQTPADAYCLYASVAINIPGMVPAWPSLSHVDVNIPPNMIPGYALYTIDGTQVTGGNWSIFAAYDSDLNRIDASDLYLSGTSPVRLRSRRYVKLCQVWLVPPFIAGGTISSNSEHIIYSMTMTGLLVPGGYAYQDGDLLDMQWDFGGVVEEYSPVPAFIEIDLGLRVKSGSWSSVQLNDWWYGGFLRQVDVDAANQFGLSSYSNDRVSSFGDLEFNPEYSYKIIAIYSGIVDGQGSGILSLELNNYYIENSNKYPSYRFVNQVFFEYINAISTYAMAYRVRISKYDPPLQRHTAYLSQSKTPVYVSTSNENLLYDENGNSITPVSGKRYDMIMYYSSDTDSGHSFKDLSVSGSNYSGIIYITFSRGDLRLRRDYGATTIQIQRVEYVVADIS